jgi:hypothetical protein
VPNAGDRQAGLTALLLALSRPGGMAMSLAVIARWGWRTVAAAGNTVKQMDFDV